MGLEQFDSLHTQGSSHGASRIFRLAYEEDEYVRLALESLPLWRRLEEDSGTAILDQTGAIDYGTRAVLDRIAAAMSRNNVVLEWLEPAEARRRWGGISFDDPVLYSRDGGRTDADARDVRCTSRRPPPAPICGSPRGCNTSSGAPAAA